MKFKIGDKVVVTNPKEGIHSPEAKIGDIHKIVLVYPISKKYVTEKGNVFEENEITEVNEIEGVNGKNAQGNEFLEGKVDAYREIIKLLLEERRKNERRKNNKSL